MPDNTTNDLALQKCQLQSERRWSDMKIEIQQVKDNQTMLAARLDKQSEMIGDIQTLSMNVSKLATNMESMLKEQQKQNERLGTLESKPAKKWENMSDKVLWFLVAAVMGYILSQLGLQ